MLFTTKALIVAILMAIFTLTSTSTKAAQPNFLVSVDEFTGSSDHPQYVNLFEGGVLTGQMDYPLLESSQVYQRPGDLVVGPDENLYFYHHGNFNGSGIMKLDANGLTLYNIPGLNTYNVTYYGGLTVGRGNIYASDNGSANERGIVEFDPIAETYFRFATNIDPIDVAANDSYVFALYQSSIYKYSLDSYQQVATFSLPFENNGYCGLAVAADGSMFVNGWNTVKKFSSNGTLLKSLTISKQDAYSLGDIDIQGDDVLLGAMRDTNVFLTDLSLSGYETIPVAENPDGSTFVAFAAPEPGPISLALIGTSLLTLRRNRRK